MRNTSLLSVIVTGACVAVAAMTTIPALAASGGPEPSISAVAAPPPSATAAPDSGPGSGATPSAAMTPGPAATNPGTNTWPGSYILQPMPAGVVSFSRDAYGRLQAHVRMYGLTPGSAHGVVIESAGDDKGWPREVFSALYATPGGQADMTLTSTRAAGWLQPASRLVIQLGSTGGWNGSELPAGEPIAETGPLPADPSRAGIFTLHAVTYGTYDVGPSGRATITFNASTRTLTVSVTAAGLTPGPHAAHIHLGSCQNQGPVKYMMADFIANAAGDITGQTRVITGVTSVPGPGAWYLNLHQGGMSQILANGVPTLAFRPMLCTNISSFASAGPAPSAAASASPAATNAQSSAPTPDSSLYATPAAQPTHW